MEVVSLSPFRCASLLWQPQNGAWVLTVVCKATFQLRPTESPLAPEQEEPNEDDNYWDDNPARSLQSASDLVPIKPRVDVFLIGHAFAPDKQPVRSLIARLIVGEVDKSVDVHCDRAFTQDGALHEGPRFTRMRLVYERAAGGPESSNPVGVRRDVRDAYGKLTVPNLQPPGLMISSPNDSINPIGFGPIAPTWPARRAKLGRHASSFTMGDLQSRPLPEEIDPTFFNCAPRDQQMQIIRGNERIILENLHPDHPRLATNLPGVHPRAFIEGRPGGPQALPMRADTLWIDTDRALCTLTWRGQVPLDHASEDVRAVVALEQPGQTLTFADIERQIPGGPRQPSQPAQPSSGRKLSNVTEPTIVPRKGRKMTLDPATFADELPNKALPFAPAQASESHPAKPGSGLPFFPKAPGSDREEHTGMRSLGLPFVPPPPPPPPPSSPSQERPDDFASRPPARLQFNAPPPASVPPPTTPPPPPQPPPASAKGLNPPPLYIAEPIKPWTAAPSPGGAPAPAPPPPPPEAPSFRSAVPAESRWAAGAPSGSTPAPSDPMPSPLHSAPAPAQVTGLSASKEAPGAAVLTASNAAAAQSAPWDMPRPDPSLAAADGELLSAQAAPRAAGRPDTRDAVELLWFRQESVLRMRKQPAWREIIDELEEKADDPEIDDIAPEREPTQIEDRRDIFEILTKADLLDAIAINDALDRSIREDGKLIPPLVMTAGELVLPFDELETLRASMTTATPFSSTDENLRATIMIARDFLGMPGLSSAPAVAEGLTSRIKDAFASGKRVVPPDYLQTQTERALLDQRHYQRRQVFGDTYLRGLLHAGGSSSPIPTYLPDHLARKLPLFARFKVRIIAEAHMPVDQFEIHPSALKVLAIARVMDRVRR